MKNPILLAYPYGILPSLHHGPALGHGPIRVGHGVFQLPTVEAPGWEGADGGMHSWEHPMVNLW
jgi:hypothetical protein